MSEAKALKKRVRELVKALRPRAIGVDPMSWHGELMVCDLCKSTWNNGVKRSDPATRETHKPDCLLYGTEEASKGC